MTSVLSTYGVLHRNFGFSLQAVRTLGLFQLRWLLNQLTGGIDHVLYPRFQSLAIDRPVFVLGNPRSGTTLMHRFLASAEELAAFELWEMLFPAISARKLLRPLIDRAAGKMVQSEEAKKIHETGLKYAETDDAFLLLNLLDGPLYWGAVQAWEPSFARDFMSEPFQKLREQRFYPALEEAWRRNLFLKRRARILVKSSAVSASMPHLLRRHPDARIIYMMRSPLEVIPSTLSLLEHSYVQPLRRVREPTAEQLQRYFEHTYLMQCELYRRFHEERTAGLLPERNLKLVSYRRLMADFAAEMGLVLDFIEVPRGQLAGQIAEHASRQRQHKSKHRYSLEQYGLTEARVRRDLDFVFKHYDVE